MRALSLTVLLLLQLIVALSQNATANRNRNNLQKEKPRQHWLLRYEKVDTTDRRTGRTFVISRAYYFSKTYRQLQVVHIREEKNRKGLAVSYRFHLNQLTQVTVIPPKQECRKCSMEYYFLHNKLYKSTDTGDLAQKEEAFISQASFLKSKMPDKLEPGYFEWEESGESDTSQEYLIVDAGIRSKH
jgi:hypothetical protein